MFDLDFSYRYMSWLFCFHWGCDTSGITGRFQSSGVLALYIEKLKAQLGFMESQSQALVQFRISLKISSSPSIPPKNELIAQNQYFTTLRELIRREMLRFPSSEHNSF